jgi:hypothetical protein
MHKFYLLQRIVVASNWEGGCLEEGCQRLGWRRSGAVATAARLATMYGPVKRLRGRWVRRVALSVVNFLVLWLCIIELEGSDGADNGGC